MKAVSNWLELGQRTTSSLKGSGADKVRARGAVNTFCSWATAENIPFPCDPSLKASVLERFEKYAHTLPLKKADGRSWSKDGEATLAWASELLRSAKQADEPVSVKGNVEPPPEEEMRDEEQNEEELDEEEEEETDDEPEELEEDEEPRQRKRRGSAPRTIVVEVPPRARGSNRREARGVARDAASPAKKLFSQQRGGIRVYMRDESAKLAHIDDYEPRDLGNQSVKEFIEQDIHPRFYLQNAAFTDYVAVLLNSQGMETTTREKLRLENPEEEASQQQKDPFNTVKTAFSTFRDLKQLVGEEEHESAAMKLMREKAKDSGDNSMMMMLAFMDMMQKNQQGMNNPMLRELLERMDRAEQRAEMMRQPPPMPMAPPPPSPEASFSGDILRLAMAKFAQPGPSLMEQAKDLATVRMALGDGGNSQIQQLTQQLAQMQTQLAQLAHGGGGKADGFKDALTNFEQVMTAVKSFAPQIAPAEAASGGGLVGFIKGILTPEVGKVIASVVTRGGEQPQQPQQAQGQVPHQQPQQLPAPQPQQAQQPQQPQRSAAPPAVIEARNHFLAALTPPVRAEKFADLITQMFLSQQYVEVLQPSIDALQKDPVGVSELKVVRKLGMDLVLEMKPEWATPEFIDSCIAALAAKLGAPVPPALVETRGRWALMMAAAEGRMPAMEVFMLDTVAREVKNEPKPIQLTQPIPPEAIPQPPPGYENVPPAQPLSAPPPERKKRLVEMDEDELAAHLAAEKAASEKVEPVEAPQTQNGAEAPQLPPPQLVPTPAAEVVKFERR